MANTNFVRRIAFHLTPETASPTVPAAGSDIASLSGWIVIGSTQASEDADLDAGSVTISLLDDKGEVAPPRSLTREEVVNFRSGVDQVEFTAYDGSETLLSIHSTMTASGNVTQPVKALTYRTMLIEINGKWYDYFPKCEVSVTSMDAGYTGDPAKTTFVVRPCATASALGGFSRHHYQ